ncbi:MAG: hypothetical protein A3G76_00365 [Acidobacteria bacterium RIFCSPLOWO2_12_FULL_65_11]|nr:MAG: hypothetical protein A3H95_15710 [Acidobacteria bacterium RIFCSPLOWO2_02_FULL_64_15]OFW32891.1 MAG: hypothetical protein A3G76_00365 [Acidobacteria bacterium RIFCSPLOWO2_12_FULL_65_11]
MKETPVPFVVLLLVAVLTAACGKRGAPLPPLVKLPAAPAELRAERRGDTVHLRFTVPKANTDDTRPANVARVDIYGFSGPLAVTDEDLIRQGTRIASVPVKTPRDPNDTIEPGESEDGLAPLVGDGLDQGASTGVQETLAPAGTSPAAPGAIVRTYVGVGVTAKGRRGPFSVRAAVPIGPSPLAPRGTSATYDELTITITWQAVDGPAQESAAGAPAAAGTTLRAIAYHVYEVPSTFVPETSGSIRMPQQTVAAETRLTDAPVADTRYLDTRMAWGATRCYIVRAVLSLDALAVEGGEASPACVTLIDTFPPLAPTGLQAVAGEGTISLIWDANAEMDLDGYVVMRAVRPGEAFISITPDPIHETTFRDEVPAGGLYAYAVVAVDRAGNRSPSSNRVEETGR